VDQAPHTESIQTRSWLDAVILFCLNNKVVVFLLVVLLTVWGLLVAPFDWEFGGVPRSPVPVDAIPDIGENQQIVFTEWMGRSPQDVEDQITYPLTVSLLGVPGVRTIRSSSFFGFSSIYIIFEEDAEFYWSRSRIIEKLNSLPSGTLPEGVQPALGPDATALGQVFWYTLEGRDPDGDPVGGWDLDELRSVQDWHVRYALLAADGVSEVASVGGFVREYQVDVDPDAMRAYGVTLEQVFAAVRGSNVDVGARTIEVNRVEYVIRGLGFIETIADIEKTVVKVADNVPVYIKDIAKVSAGPALRRGALDKEGAEAVGGVVVVRYGANPLEVINNVKAAMAEIAPGLPTRPVLDETAARREEVAQFAKARGFEAWDGPRLNEKDWLAWLRATPRADWPPWITTSQIAIVPFYDRTGLIYETLGTLSTALYEEILVTIIVVLVMVMHLRSSALISSSLPLAVLVCFIAMKLFHVDANIVALSGIAIAIGTIVDMGVIITENILKHLDEAEPGADRLTVVYKASSEVAGAVLTAVATTVVGFLPVFTMTGAEGKLFRPLAFTKTFALIASVIVAVLIIPPAAHTLLAGRTPARKVKRVSLIALALAGCAIGVWLAWWAGVLVTALALYHLAAEALPAKMRRAGPWAASGVAVIAVGVILARHWVPLGPDKGPLPNLFFLAILIGGLLALFKVFERVYAPLLRWFLRHKGIYLTLTVVVVFLGAMVWVGFGRVFGFAPQRLRETRLWGAGYHAFPGLGKEFMPPLDEGSFLYMPTTMPHASIGEVLEVLEYQDRSISSIPEVESAVGKLGRVESPLDPAPVSMIETVINYKPEYAVDKDGHRLTFRYDETKGAFARDERGGLIPDPAGRPFRQWRDQIKSPDDIWDEILKAAAIPGTTSAPRLQPIAARLVMLQSGMRAPMGVKVRGPDLDSILRSISTARPLPDTAFRSAVCRTLSR